MPIAQNQLCLEAQQTPMQGQGGQRRALEETEEQDEVEGRQLGGQQYTPDDCFQACSFTGLYTLPFYMNFYQPLTGPAECWAPKKCSGATLCALFGARTAPRRALPGNFSLHFPCHPLIG